jgi:hypothetical protein
MRIAILFIGYARTFGQLKENYKNYFPCHSDVFMQIYDTFYATPDLDKVCAVNIENATYTNKQYFEDVFPNIVYFDNPKFNANAMRDIVKKNKLPPINGVNQECYRTFAMFSNLKKIINAKNNYEKKHKFKYDCVIITRLDLRLDSLLAIPKNLSCLSFPVGEGYFPNGERRMGCAPVFGTKVGLNDQIMICNSDIANILGKIFDNIIKYSKEGIMINNETLIGQHCIKNKIKFGPVDIIKYMIWR